MAAVGGWGWVSAMRMEYLHVYVQYGWRWGGGEKNGGALPSKKKPKKQKPSGSDFSLLT